MFSTPRLIVAVAALAVVAAVVAWIYRQGGDAVRTPSKGRTMKLAALRTMSALALTFALQGMWDFGAGKCRRIAPRGGH